MYYLVTYREYGKRNKVFDGFGEIKEAVIKQLDGRGWDNKETVDLKSVKSCLDYLFDDVSFQKTTSFKKSLEFEK